jgi:hypothetical protein
MNNDFDINEFAKMFDAALASDNPAVKKALRNFMMVSAIVHAQELDETERTMGPLETLVKKVADLERIVRDLQNYNQYTRPTKEDYYSNKYKETGYPTWIYQPTTSISTTSGTTWKTSAGYTAQDLSELLKDIKFDE